MRTITSDLFGAKLHQKHSYLNGVKKLFTTRWRKVANRKTPQGARTAANLGQKEVSMGSAICFAELASLPAPCGVSVPLLWPLITAPPLPLPWKQHPSSFPLSVLRDNVGPSKSRNVSEICQKTVSCKKLSDSFLELTVF